MTLRELFIRRAKYQELYDYALFGGFIADLHIAKDRIAEINSEIQSRLRANDAAEGHQSHQDRRKRRKRVSG